MDYSILYEYFIVLFYKYNYDDISLLNRKDYDLDLIYKYIYEIWKEYSDEILDLNNEEDKELLYDFLSEKFRYKMLNDCLDELYECLTEEKKDKFLINNLSDLSDVVNDVIKKNKYYDKEIKDLPKLSHEDLDKYFREFLLSIDSSKEYLKTYEYMINNKKIVFIDSLDEKHKKYFKMLLDIEDDDYNNFTMKDKGFIVIDRKEDISDFRTLMHEFIHYYIYQQNKEKEPHFLLCEFPSMIYEYFANNFLVTKGYSNEDIKKLFLFRFNEMSKKSEYLKVINYYLKLYNDNNFIVTEEIDIDRMKQTINVYIDKEGIEKYKEKIKENNNLKSPEIMAKDYCDAANFYLVRNPYELVHNFPYLIGHFLSIHFIEEFVNNNFNHKELKEMTKNISDIDSKIILDIYKNNKEEKKRLL